MSAIPTHLNEILQIVGELSAQSLRTLAVFDLDSTLFNVSTRTQKILNEFADERGLDHLKAIAVHPQDWGLQEAFARAGFSGEKDAELMKDLRHYWARKFFSNEYLHYDVPYLGAVTFVQELADSGCDIKYLTGRDVARMQKGTEDVLRKWGFPLEPDMLHLKPDLEVDDELFKQDWFRQLDQSSYRKVFFFENEPVNVNAISANCPHVEIIFVDTTHSRKQEMTLPLKKIKNFHRG